MLVRTNPLQPGYYWVDYNPESAGGKAFEAWLRANPTKVRSYTTEKVEAGDPWYTVWPSELYDNLMQPDLVWMLFQVKEPINWDAKAFGFWPNTTAQGAATTKDDTVQKPSPEEATAGIDARIKSAVWTVFWMGVAFYGVTQIPKLLADGIQRKGREDT
jgi:hypothetical protein